jgi:large subunit ribosomal protein L24
MDKLNIKKGDLVKVIAGAAKGKDGKVLMVMVDKRKVIVEGINLVSKHTKPNAKHPKGGIIKKELSVDISNVMLLDSSKIPTRVGRKLDKNNKLVRYSKKSGEEIK